MKYITYMLSLVLFLCVLACFTACETTDEKETFTADKKSLNMIEETELLLLRYKHHGDSENLIKARALIKQLEKLAENNKRFEAKVLGLQGELALARQNIPLVNENISYIEERNLNEEKLFILRAELERDIKEKKKILLQGIKKADTKDRLKLMLAGLNFTTGHFKKSVNLYDEVFVALPGIYRTYYQKHRDLAYRFTQNPPNDRGIIPILLRAEVTYREMIDIMISETDVLDQVIKVTDVKQTLKNLYDKGYFYYESRTNPDDMVKRKDAAYFFLHILAKVTNDSSLTSRFKNREDYFNKVQETEVSPVPDVPSSEYYYTSVLRTVEREIMDLPDGEHFFPEMGLSGIRIFEIVKKLEE